MNETLVETLKGPLGAASLLLFILLLFALELRSFHSAPLSPGWRVGAWLTGLMLCLLLLAEFAARLLSA